MKPAKTSPPASAAAATLPAPVLPASVRWMRWVVGTIVSIHLAIALSLIFNHVSRAAIVSGSDAWHMLYFHQFAEGGHSYYPRGDVAHVTDGYTPLASEIFGWTIRLCGTDIRWVRMVTGLFGLAGM